MPPKLSLAHKRGHLLLFQNYPRGEGKCETTERQKLSRGIFLPRDIKVSLLAHWVGFEERNMGCPGNFAGMSLIPGGVRKVCAKNVRAHFSSPIDGRQGRDMWHHLANDIAVLKALRVVN